MRITIKPFLRELGRKKWTDLFGWRFAVLRMLFFTPAFSGVWDWLIWPILMFIFAPSAMVVYALLIQSDVSTFSAVMVVCVSTLFLGSSDMPYGEIPWDQVPARFRAEVKHWRSLLIKPSPAV